MVTTYDRSTWWGKGAVMTDDGLLFSGFAEFRMKLGLESLSIPDGQLGGGAYDIPVSQPIGGTIGCHEVSAAMLALLTGGTAAKVAGSNRPVFISKESVAVASQTGTLAQTPITGTKITLEDANGNVFYEVTAGNEILGEAFSRSDKTLTFKAGEPDKTMYATYFYLSSGGTELVLDPESLPSAFKLYGVIRAMGVATVPDFITAVCNRVRRKAGDIDLGANRDGHDALSFEFSAQNRYSGDVKLYFPDA